MKESLLSNPVRALPDSYHSRLGLRLDPSKSKVYNQIENIKNYANANEMKLNVKKCKFMLFNPTLSHDFKPELQLVGDLVETVEEMKLLGLTVRSDLSWKSNTKQIVAKAYKRLWMIKRLKNHGANLNDLKEIYFKQIRAILEFGAPVWNSGLTKAESTDIERVQKAFLHIALGNNYQSYKTALEIANIEPLEDRRIKLCLTFAKKSLKHPKHSAWFQYNVGAANTRSSKPNLKVPLYRLARFRDSPIPYLTNLLNRAK